MKVVVCPERDEAGKYRGVVQAFAHIWTGQVLDVGCRSGAFGTVLRERRCTGDLTYCGLDLRHPADVIADLDQGLPFQAETHDVVVALDVLEHTNDLHRAFMELCRVSRKFVVITLPNAYELRGRLKFLVGRPFSGKYGLPVEPPEDRHRWVFSFEEAMAFVWAMAEKAGFEVVVEACLIGPRRARFGGWITRLFPNLLSPWYLVLLQRSARRPQ